MTIEGEVWCRCWRDGLTTAPPADLRIGTDANGKVEMLGPDDERARRAFSEWFEHACPHEWMRPGDDADR